MLCVQVGVTCFHKSPASALEHGSEVLPNSDLASHLFWCPVMSASDNGAFEIAVVLGVICVHPPVHSAKS